MNSVEQNLKSYCIIVSGRNEFRNITKKQSKLGNTRMKIEISSYMVPLWAISGQDDVIWKKFQKSLISRFFVSELFFRNEYQPIFTLWTRKWPFWPLYWWIDSNFRSDNQFVSKWLFLRSVPSVLQIEVSHVI